MRGASNQGSREALLLLADHAVRCVERQPERSIMRATLAKVGIRLAEGMRASLAPLKIDVALNTRSFAVGAYVKARGFAAAASGLSKEEVTERVISVVKNFDKVDPAKVTPTAEFSKDLGLDSLDTVEVVMAFEEEFSIEIPDDDADKIASCTSAIDYLAKHAMVR